MDNISKEERSRVMAAVKQKDTKPEMVVRRFLHRIGFRYRLHNSGLPGKPDLVLPRYKSVIFVHGCFWHGHTDVSCRLSRIPKSNIDFWKKKISINQTRDERIINELHALGWRVFVIWECQVNDESVLKTLVNLLTA